MTPLLLSEMLAGPAAGGPAQPALHSGNLTLDFGRLKADVDRVAVALAGLGLGPGDVVAVHLRKPVSHWVVTLALMRLGAVTASLTDNFTGEIAVMGSVAAVICAPEEEGPSDYPGALRRIPVDPLWLAAPELDRHLLPPAAPVSGNVGRICFTSGTTGRPKAILLDASLLAARLSATARRTRIGAASVLWCGLGPDTAYGFTATLAAWHSGAAVILSDGGPGAFADMRAKGLNLILSSPAALRAILRDAASAGLPHLRGPVLIAGGRLTADFRDAIRAHLTDDVLIAYGSSETGGVTLGHAVGLDLHAGYVGDVFPDVEVAIVDDAGRPCRAGETGLIRVRTASTARGYLGEAAVSLTNFRDGWFGTGDLGYLDGDGALIALGRPTEFLNIGGVKMRADEIEERVRVLPQAEDACALQVVGPGGATELAILFQGSAGDGPGVGMAIRHDMARLPRFILVAMPTLPRGSMGKVNRRALAALIEAAMRAPQSAEMAAQAVFTGRF